MAPSFKWRFLLGSGLLATEALGRVTQGFAGVLDKEAP